MRVDILLAISGLSFLSFAAGFWLLGSLRHPRADGPAQDLLACLPAWDCGLCGQADCSDYAASLAKGPVDSRCAPGGTLAERRLAAVLGRQPYRKRGGKSVAIVACAGAKRIVRPVFRYYGYRDCLAAAGLYGGPRACGSGCMGFGSCVPSCPVGAISVQEGLAVIHADLCDGCGACISACPTGVLRMLPRRDAWYVACSSAAPGKVKAASCAASCTACEACARRSAGSEFSIRNNLAVPSTNLTGDWAAIAADCPTGVIRNLGG
ncbi:MAG TPA: 4Fe-4S dicluster domain-containing protein [Magnetospirillaceae bacterium]|nr:4Fe-4S dicluster domain-containing protein [Magnetospirillaceae bacterium]